MHATREVRRRLKSEIDYSPGESADINLVIMDYDESSAAVRLPLLDGVAQSLKLGNEPIRPVDHETGVGVLCNTTNFIPFSMWMTSSRFVYLCRSLPCLLASVVWLGS